MPRQNPYTVAVNPTVSLQDTLKQLHQIMAEAVGVRVRNLSDRPRLPGEARVAILFSGGVDCATLACLAAESLSSGEPVDLLNVAFESPRVAQRLSPDASIYDTPDRLTGRQTWAELRQLYPGRKWRFVEVDVSFTESEQDKAEIMRLMKPHATIMDHSIGMALFYAARGRGSMIVDNVRHAYTSTARILLSGLGADELFGGYLRHKRAFANASGAECWMALAKEMELDLQRIGTRNLGRDDRCISTHGKEARYPFLAEPVIDFVLSLPMETKCDPRLPDGEGDKILLRRLASSLGLEQASKLKKRAMQFGSRSAKRQPGQTDGTALIV